MELRNIAIIAHVDHGKTTLVDAMLHQSGLFHAKQQVEERVMDSNDLEKERGITIQSKNASIELDNVRLNLVDTPGHADFSGEVERILRMVDGVLLLVDAAEGPMPQTRFVLERSLALGLRPVVVINKVDRPDQRVHEVEDEVLELFIALEADDDQLEYPTLFASGRDGVCSATYEGFADAKDLRPLMEAIPTYVPAPSCSKEGPLKLLVSQIEHSEFVGRQLVGRVEQGVLRKGQPVVALDADGVRQEGRVGQIEVFDGLGRKQVEEAEAGEIVILAGLAEADIGDTVSDPSDKEPLPRLEVAPPTLAMEFHVNDSPFAGQEGKYVTSRQLRERLYRESLYDRALHVSDTDAMETFRVAGRGELHLSILIEKMRREGYEFCVSRPEVLLKEDPELGKLEPIEETVVDVPGDCAGAVIERLGQRRGVMENMHPMGDRTRIVFAVPTRGLIGFRTDFLTMTRGEGILTHRLREYGPWSGEITHRTKGVLISMEKTVTVPYAIFNLEERGEFLVGPGVPVYGGMIVALHSRPNDLVVNVGKTKKLTNVRASGSDENVLLTPPLKLSLEGYLELINDDEWIEVTPESIRARKKYLDHNKRKQFEKRRGAEQA